MTYQAILHLIWWTYRRTYGVLYSNLNMILVPFKFPHKLQCEVFGIILVPVPVLFAVVLGLFMLCVSGYEHQNIVKSDSISILHSSSLWTNIEKKIALKVSIDDRRTGFSGGEAN